MKQNNWNVHKEILPSKNLRLIPNSPESMKELIEKETDPVMSTAYQEMLDAMVNDPKNWLWYTNWSVYLKCEKQTIGGICFMGPANEKGEVTIGYGIDEAYQSMGFGSEAVETIINWAFSNNGVYFVMAETDADNLKSQGLLKKLAFKETGLIGEEGPLFELERPASNYMSIYMCLGISIGLCFGMSILNNMALGICFGVGIGTAFGAYLDQTDKKKRRELSAKREHVQDENQEQVEHS